MSHDDRMKFNGLQVPMQEKGEYFALSSTGSGRSRGCFTSSHKDGPDKRWTEFNLRNGGRFHFIFTPIHASSLNQAECFLSIANRRVIQHADFKSVDDATARVVGFVDYWNKFEAHPFRWTWRYQAKEHCAAKAA